MSDFGNVRRASDFRRVSAHFSNGYRRAWLVSPEGRRMSVSVARLVAESFGVRVNGHNLSRANGVRSDDRLDNLCLAYRMPPEMRSLEARRRCGEETEVR